MINPVKSVTAFPLLLILVILIFTGCREDTDTLEENLISLDPDIESPETVTPERIEEIKQAINRYKNIVEKKVEAAGQLAEYYKMLGIAYLDMRMHSLAFEAFQNAIQIETENQILFYYAGVTKARAAKAEMDDPDREEMFREAEDYYRRSINIDPSYREAAYGLAVLYVFELNEPSRAIPILNNLLNIQISTDALFVLARAYAAVGNVNQAVDTYERILQITDNPNAKRRASENIEALIGGESGG
jgi:tetratricopeptide (TPR) repeat protein